MNKLDTIINKFWFTAVFFGTAILINVALHFRVFSLDLIGIHVWRQTQTQTVIDNFANTDFNILNPRLNDLHYHNGIFRMEFPLAQWLIAGLFKLFGSNIWISRGFFLAITTLTMVGFFKLTKTLTKNVLVSCLGVWLFTFSPIIYYYSVNPMPDNLALCLVVWALYFWFVFLAKHKLTFLIFSALFFSIAVGVKLPFIVFGGMYLPVFLDKKCSKKALVLTVILIALLPFILWYAWAIPLWENGVVGGVFSGDTSWRMIFDYLQFNIISTLPELLINYVTLPIFFIGLWYVIKNIKLIFEKHESFVWIGLLTSVYYLYEINMIARVHDYYLFPFLPLIFIIIVKGLLLLISMNNKWTYIILVAFLISPLTAYLRCDSRWNIDDPGFTKEYLEYKEQIQSIIPVTAKIIVYNDESRCIVLYHLNRKGWSYGKYPLQEKQIEDNYKNGAKYFVTDCVIDTMSVLKKWQLNLIFKKGPVNIYSIQ